MNNNQNNNQGNGDYNQSYDSFQNNGMNNNQVPVNNYQPQTPANDQVATNSYNQSMNANVNSNISQNYNMSNNQQPIMNNYSQPMMNNTQQPIMNNYNQGMNQNFNNMNGYQQNTNYYNNSNNSYGSEKKKPKSKVLIVILIIVGILILLGIIKSCSSAIKKGGSIDRLIMVYMVGSNLESDMGAGTLDLDGVSYSKLNDQNTKLIVMAGGSPKWHNSYIDTNHSSIYELTSNGYKVVKDQNVTNMGDSSTYKDFLNYGYDNYNAKKYDLIMWNHGLGALGGESDDLSGDFLQASEMKAALEASPFRKNKLELVMFRTCLNGTLEIADTFKDYAEYMVASQEVTWMYKTNNLFTLLNNIKSSDGGKDFGKKFVDGYMNYIGILNTTYNYSTYNTYALLDLSKVNDLEVAIGDFFNDINLQTSYNQVAKARSLTLQYGKSQDSTFDSIDIYSFVNSLRSLSPTKADKVLNLLKNVVIYNKSSDSNSNGLSIYFPYNGEEKAKTAILTKFYDFNGLSNYKSFITAFNSIQNSNNTPISLASSAASLIHDSSAKSSDFQIKLSDKQFETFDRATYMIFEKEDSENFLPVYQSKSIYSENKVLKGNIKDRQLEIINDSDNGNALVVYTFKTNESNEETMQIEYDTIKKQQITLIEEEETDDYIRYSAIVLLSNNSIIDSVQGTGGELKIDHGKLYLKLDKKTNNVSVESVAIKSETKGIVDNKTINQYNIAVDLNDYKYISFTYTTNKIKDKNNIKLFENEPSTIQAEIKNLKFKLASYSSNKEYYALFKIFDVYGNSSYSELIKIK